MSKNIRNKTSLGVELQGSETRLVLLENTTPSPTLVQTQTVRGEELGKALRALPKRPSNVTCSISLQHAAVRILDLPPTTDENLERVVALEAEGVVPMGTEDLALSHHTLGMTEQSRLEVMVGAGRLPDVQNTLKTVNCAPWVSATVTVSAVALYNALQALRGSNRESVSAILCIEEHTTELIVADRSRILLAQAIPIGCGDVATIPDFQPLPVGAAVGAAEAEAAASALAPASAPWLVTLSQQVRYPLQALSYERGLPAERLYVCGSGAALADVDLQLSERLDMPVSILSPSGTENRQDARYAVAYGCALQAAGVAPVALNLTPARVTVARESEQRKQTQISWGALAAAGVLAAFLIFQAMLHNRRQYAAQLHRQVLQAPTNVKKPPMSPEDLKKTLADVQEASGNRVPASRALAAFSQALPKDTWLAELNYTADNSCVLRGFSKTPQAAQQAQVNLFNQRLFDDVSLDYQNEEKIGKTTAWGFQITCKLRQKELGNKRGGTRR